MLFLVCLALCGTLALGQEHHCCTPNQWEGYYNSITGYVYGDHAPDAVLEDHQVHYDFMNNRTAATIKAYHENSGHTDMVKVIENFKTKKRLFIRGNECTISNLDHDMVPPCLPPNAIHLGHYYIGAGTSHLDVDSWALPMNYPDEFHIRTAPGCIPYQYRRVIIDSEHDFGMAAFTSFSRITPGIKDDSVFDTPSECTPRKHQIIPKPIKDALSMFHK